MNIYNHHKGIYIYIYKTIMYQASGSGGQFPHQPLVYPEMFIRKCSPKNHLSHRPHSVQTPAVKQIL